MCECSRVCGGQSLMLGVSLSFPLHFSNSFSLSLELAAWARSAALASPALGLQKSPHVPGFYTVLRCGLNSDPHGCMASPSPTEPCPPCLCDAVCPTAGGGSSSPQLRRMCHPLSSACMGDARLSDFLIPLFSHFLAAHARESFLFSPALKSFRPV